MKRKSDEIFNKIFYVTREEDYSQYETILVCDHKWSKWCHKVCILWPIPLQWHSNYNVPLLTAIN